MKKSTGIISFIFIITFVAFANVSFSSDSVLANNKSFLTNKFVSKPTISLNAQPASVVEGSNTNITWSATNALMCSTSWGGRGLQGVYTTPAMTKTQNFSVNCSNRYGQRDSKSINIAVVKPVVNDPSESPAPRIDPNQPSPLPIFVNASDFIGDKLKGFTIGVVSMVNSEPKDYYSDFAKTGANLGRVWFVPKILTSSPRYKIEESQFQDFDKLLLLADKYKFKIVIVMDQLAKQNGIFWTDPRAQNDFVDLWKEIAKRYSHSTAIAAFDLMNEPIFGGDIRDAARAWEPVVRRTIEAIRSVDKNHTIIIEPADGAIVESFEYLTPIMPEDKNLVYSLHMYGPFEVTHQGIPGTNLPMGKYYPSLPSEPQQYNSEYLKNVMRPVVNFQKKYNVPIFVGEFSCVRWAPENSRYNHLKDAISFFEENNWSWAYHAWREYDGWDAEIPSNDRQNQVRTGTGPVIELLKSYFEKTPAWKFLPKKIDAITR